MKRSRNHSGHVRIEPLEQRSLLAANPSYLISFYGLGGAGGFGEDWLDKTVDTAGERTQSVVRKYREDEGGRALKDFLRSADRNRNHRIDKAEVASLNVRVIGHSFGGVQAANFARYLMKVGQTVKGYLIGQATPIKALVTIDPVDDPLAKHTLGVPNNVYNFANYYQQHGGDTKVSVYTRTTPSIKVDTITVTDRLNIKGNVLPTEARKSKQIRIDVGPYADQTVKHRVETKLDGKLKGSDVNHGSIPFFTYDLAVDDLVR